MAPTSRSTASCATCCTPILPRHPRARHGAAGARVHHIGCVSPILGDPQSVNGWQTLTVEQQIAVQAAAVTATTAPPGGQSPGGQDDDPMDPVPNPQSRRTFVDPEWWSATPWSALHDSIRTLATVPASIRADIAELRGAIAKAILEHAGTDLEDCCWKAFIFLDRLLFNSVSKRRGGVRGQRGETLCRTLCRRLRMAWAGQWAALWHESSAAAAGGLAHAPLPGDRLYKDVRDIEKALAAEDMREALRCVDGRDGLAPDSKARACLPALFPCAPAEHQPAPGPMPPPAPEDIIAFDKELASAFRYSPPRRGPGPGGGRGEHWHWLPEFPAAWQPVCAALRRFALGLTPASTTSALLSARILAADRTDKPNAVRPLALGVFVRRCTSKAVARVFRPRVARILAPVEHSLGCGRGAEVMHKTVLTDFENRDEAVEMSLDVSNAHNSFSRRAALDEIAVAMPALLPWAAPMLQTTATHVWHAADGSHLEISKTAGGDQGDALVSIVYPIVNKRPVRLAAAAARAVDPLAREYTYQDDLELVCSPGAAAPAREAFRAGCESVNLSHNASKDALALGRGVDPATLPSTLTAILEPRALVLRHGGPLPIPAAAAHGAGPDSLLEAQSPEVTALIKKRRAFLGRLRALRIGGLPSQVALALAQARTAGDCIYVARTCGLPATDAEALDSLLETEVLSLLGDGPRPTSARDARARGGEHATSRVFLPARDHGLGFMSLVMVRAAAHTASWHSALPHILSRLGLPSPVSLTSRTTWSSAAIQESIRYLHHATGDATAELGDTEVDASQHSLTLSSYAAASSQLTAMATDPVASSALLSCGGIGAGACLRAPTAPAHRLLDAQFRMTLSTRLQLAVFAPGGICRHRRPDGSLCGAPMDVYGIHARCCAVGGWRVKKHNACVNALAAWAEEEAECNVFKEQVVPIANDEHTESRLDLVIYSPRMSGAIYVDLTIASACSQEALSRGSAGFAGVAASIAEERKCSKYPNIDPWPFAIEDHGRWGDSAIALSRALAPPSLSLRSASLRRLQQAVAVALQRTAADAMLAAMQ